MNKIAMLATCLVALTSFAQTTVKEPEFADTFAALSASGDLVPLERETATIHAGVQVDAVPTLSQVRRAQQKTTQQLCAGLALLQVQ